jgi:hypothetical protein
MSRGFAAQVLSAVVAVVVTISTPFADDHARSAKVSLRIRLGNDLEAMTRLSPESVAVLDGYDVVAIQVPNTPSGKAVPTAQKKLFDVRSLPTGPVVPRGLAYDTTRERFYFGPGSGGLAPVILVTDRDGRRRPDITLKLLPGQVTPVQFESLAYIPPGNPRFGDRIAAVLIGEDLIGRISIIRLDGTVEYEIPVASGSPAENYITGLAFVPPDRFLFTPLAETGSTVYQLDLAGSVTGPMLAGDPNLEFEGIAPLAGGRVAVVDYAAGWVFVYDATGTRLAHQDRDIRIGAGIAVADSIAWDSGAGRVLVNAGVGGGSPARGIWSFDSVTGGYRSRLALASFPTPDFRPRRVTPLPDGQLAVRALQRPDLVHVFSHNGATDPVDPTVTVPTLVRTITLSVPQPIRSSLDFDETTGRLLIGRKYYDLAGIAVGTLTGIPSDFLGQNFVHVTSGPYAGQVAGVDGAASELVIFRP